MIRSITDKDINAWLKIAKEVEPLFGQMVVCKDFENGIKAAISDSAAFCIINEEDEVQGIIAVNKVENEIAWLAVGKEHRGKGYGFRLIKAGVESLDNKKPIFVHTFAPSEKAGAAARQLYKRFGFIDDRECGKNPAGINIIRMKLNPVKE